MFCGVSIAQLNSGSGNQSVNLINLDMYLLVKNLPYGTVSNCSNGFIIKISIPSRVNIEPA